MLGVEERLGHLQGARGEGERARAGSHLPRAGARRRDAAARARHARRDGAAEVRDWTQGRVRADPRQDDAAPARWSSATTRISTTTSSRFGPVARSDGLSAHGIHLAPSTTSTTSWCDAAARVEWGGKRYPTLERALDAANVRPAARAGDERRDRVPRLPGRGEEDRACRSPTWPRSRAACASPSRTSRASRAGSSTARAGRASPTTAAPTPRTASTSSGWCRGARSPAGSTSTSTTRSTSTSARTCPPTSRGPDPTVLGDLLQTRTARTRHPPQLPHPARQVAHPLHLRRQPAHAHALARRRAALDQRQGRGAGGHRGQRLGRGGNDNGVMVTRAVVSARVPDGHLHRLPLAGAHHRRAEEPLAGQSPRRRPQQPDPRAAEADADGRRLRAVHLRLQLLGPDRVQPRHLRLRPQAREAEPRGRRNGEGHGRTRAGLDGLPPRQVHRLPHLQRRLQEPVDRPARHRVHVVEQRRDEARHRLPDAVGGPGALQGRLRARRTAASSSARAARPRRSRTSSTTRRLPVLDDYYEPWTYRYEDLFDAPEGDDQPARAAGLDDHRRADRHRARARTGTTTSAARPIYAANDPNLVGAGGAHQLDELGLLLPAARSATTA